jgi:hypothetical protein
VDEAALVLEMECCVPKGKVGDQRFSEWRAGYLESSLSRETMNTPVEVQTQPAIDCHVREGIKCIRNDTLVQELCFYIQDLGTNSREGGKTAKQSYGELGPGVTG